MVLPPCRKHHGEYILKFCARCCNLVRGSIAMRDRRDRGMDLFFGLNNKVLSYMVADTVLAPSFICVLSPLLLSRANPSMWTLYERCRPALFQAPPSPKNMNLYDLKNLYSSSSKFKRRFRLHPCFMLPVFLWQTDTLSVKREAVGKISPSMMNPGAPRLLRFVCRHTHLGSLLPTPWVHFSTTER